MESVTQYVLLMNLDAYSLLDRLKGTHQHCSSMLLMLMILLATGCASLPDEYPRGESTALQEHQSTSMGQRTLAAEQKHPGLSGFAIIRDGRNAFSTRIAMTDLAEKTLDLQYYIWESDETGRILAERLVRAADRGVRIRLLVDDMGVGADDKTIATLDAHPDIEIRIFNPFANRKAKLLDFVADMSRVNHRMHITMCLPRTPDMRNTASNC